jgi:hypothetical protein
MASLPLTAGAESEALLQHVSVLFEDEHPQAFADRGQIRARAFRRKRVFADDQQVVLRHIGIGLDRVTMHVQRSEHSGSLARRVENGQLAAGVRRRVRRQHVNQEGVFLRAAGSELD